MSHIPGLTLNKPGEIFLCGTCLKVMCVDCVSMADEFQYQNQSFKRATMTAQDELKEAKVEIALLKRQVADWKRLATLGYPEVIQKWIESQVQP